MLRAVQRPQGVASWDSAQVSNWLQTIGLADAVAAFAKESISGATLPDLSETDLKELGLNIGQRKNFLRERDALMAQQVASTGKPSPKLPKGFLPLGKPLTDKQRDKIKFNRFDMTSRKWVVRDVPLNDEELECWNEQAQWLICPITGKKWGDKSTILGVGIYHAPRFLSKAEEQRKLDEELAATQKNAKVQGLPSSGGDTARKALKASADATKVPVSDPPTVIPTPTASITPVDGSASATVSSVSALTTIPSSALPPSSVSTSTPVLAAAGGRAGLKASSGGNINVDWAKDFEPFPSVQPPPKQNLEQLGMLDEDVPLGQMQIVIGPAFDIDAFNDGVDGNKDKGILSQEQRGVLSMDQQWNAINFVYHVKRADGPPPSYELKLCTNRLSFFIDDFHGWAVFPENIESQLALIVYRDASRLKDETGKTDPRKLAKVISRVIPRVLRAVVIEVINGQTDSIAERLDHAIRTYLLVHQISIRLIIYYREAYEYLYRSVVNWIQNPFSEQSARMWPDLEELLLGASLVGMPWGLLREAFVRRFFVYLIENSSKISDAINIRRRLRHYFEQNQRFIRCVLYELSFFLASKPLLTQDRIYSRCAGSLPKRDREDMKRGVLAVNGVDTLEKVWILLGMDAPGTDIEILLAHMEAYFKFLFDNILKWRAGRDSRLDKDPIRVPSLEEAASIASVGILQYNSELALRAAQAEAEERRKHLGFPKLNRVGNLDPLVCNYPDCGKRFSCRDHLFRHLKRMIPAERMVTSYHQLHFKMKVDGDYDYKAGLCRACGKIFPDDAHLRRHFGEMGVRGFGGEGKAAEKEKEREAKDKAKEEKENKHLDAYNDQNLCCICLDAARQMVNIPCGHLVCCKTCGFLQKTCPICRAEIKSVVTVYYA